MKHHEKPGWVYFISAGPFVKIGWSAGLGDNRLDDMQTGCPYRMQVEVSFEGTIRDERAMHWHFAQQHERGEWFRYEGRLKSFLEDTLSRPKEPFTDAERDALLTEANKVWAILPTRKAANAHWKKLTNSGKGRTPFTWVAA
jgi:hypothetical protein